MMIFLVIMTDFCNPSVEYQNTHISIIAGKARPSAAKIVIILFKMKLDKFKFFLPDRQSAPNRDMNNSRLGIAIASKTKIKILK